MRTPRLTNAPRVAEAVLFFIMAAAQCAIGATYAVTNINDSGAGSLRQAILSANASSQVADTISFNISGGGPFTITPLTALPTVTDPVTIDGYTQTGSSQNTLTNGDNAVLKIVVNGLLTIDTSNCVIRGLSIQTLKLGSDASTVPIGSNVVQGCFVGLDTTGTNSLNGAALYCQIPYNQVGGTTPAARNVISGHTGFSGIEILLNGSWTTIQGNFIGTDYSGTRAIGSTDRAVVCGAATSTNVVGGTTPGARNIIAGNHDRGITLDGSNNIVQGNFIGTDVTGTNALGNWRTGVEIGGTGNLVGGTNAGAGNIIAFNGINSPGAFATTNGVDYKNTATGSAVLGNSIFNNMGLGIDVNGDELITAGFPVLTVVSNTGPASTLIRGTYTPSTTFRLELFVNTAPNPSGYGEGKTLLVSSNITTDAGGNFSINWPAAIPIGLYLTATGDGKTEFCQDRLVIAAVGTNSWTNSVGGKWETSGNWSLNAYPFSGQYQTLITNALTKTVTNDSVTATGYPGSLTISNLTISAPGGATNTLLLAHGNTNTSLHVLRLLTLNSGGALVVSNAALSIEGQGFTPCGIDGALTLNNGLLSVLNSQLYIGNNGTGSFNVSNGTFQAYYPIVGLNAGANGTWAIGGGSNIINSTFDIADSLTATGRVVLTGGGLSAPNCYVALFGNGTLIVSNGVFNCAGTVDVASQPGSVGNFIAAGGLSTMSGLTIGESTGATGAVLVTGTAVVQNSGDITEQGSITVAGGQFFATNGNSYLSHASVSNGAFLARDVFLGNGSGKSGVFNVNAGAVVALPGSFNGFVVGGNSGTGVVSQAGGQILLTNTYLNIGGLFSPAVGTMTVSNGTTIAGKLFVGGQGGGTGTMKLEGGTVIASNLQVNSTSQLVFDQGLLQALSAGVSNAAVFQVGDGAHSATYQLLGGTNAFAAGLRIATNAMLAGSGTVAGNVTNFGALSPGAFPGQIGILGRLVLSNSSDLRIELGGYTPGTQFDFLSATGGITLGGKLSVSLSNNFQSIMTNGASFTIVSNSTALAGAFTNVASGGVLTTTEGYARFTVLYAGSTTVRLTNLVIVDSDGDGMPDWWEDLYGLNKNSSADASLDLDGDGASNLNEFLAGTQPNNSNSVFKIVSIKPETNNVRVTWTTVGGKSYVVQTNASLPGTFADSSPVIPVPGTGESTTNFLHAGSLTNSPRRYYRVRLGP
jgi:hypothetical protein